MMHDKHLRRWPTVFATGLVLTLLGGCAELDSFFSSLDVETVDSKAVAEEMARKRPDVSPSGWYAINLRVGHNALKNNNYSAATQIFRRLHDTMPRRLEPLLGLGDALFAQKAYNEAADAFRTALALKSDDHTARRGLGEALVQSGRVQDGIMHLERALANGKKASLFNKIGVAHEIDGAPETAQAYFRSGLALHPDNIPLRNNLALSLALSGNYPEAVSQMRRVLEHPAANRRHRMNLAFVHGMSGDFEAAQLAVGVAAEEPDAAVGTQRLTRIRNLALAGDRRHLLKMLNVSAASVPQTVQLDGAGAEPGSAVTAAPDHDVINVNRKPADVTRNAPNSSKNIIEIAAVESEKSPLTNGNNEIIDLISGFKMGHAGIHRKSKPEVNAGQDRDPHAAQPNSITGDYRVQIGAYRNKGTAVRGRDIFTRLAPELLERLETVVKTSKSASSKAVNYRLRTAPLENQMQAHNLCENLKSKGIQCLVIKQNNRLWSTA